MAEAAVTPRPPVGLFGDWVHTAPAALQGDTLSLRADSTARGLIPWDEKRAARVTRWKLISARMIRSPHAQTGAFERQVSQ